MGALEIEDRDQFACAKRWRISAAPNENISLCQRQLRPAILVAQGTYRPAVPAGAKKGFARAAGGKIGKKRCPHPIPRLARFCAAKF